MGTNYYYQRTCGDCGHVESYHIGKSSAGWCFALHVGTEENPLVVELRQKYEPLTFEIRDWPDWLRVFEKGAEIGWSIVDEYGTSHTVSELTDTVTNRSWPLLGRASSQFDFARNHAEPGPNGLVRSQVYRHCVGHGAGTWDLIVGEFS